MGKRGVINPVYGMTTSAFFGKIRSSLRKLWSHSQQKKDAIARAKIPYKGGGRRKYSIKCECCGTEYGLNDKVPNKKLKAYTVHHIEECGQLKSFADIQGFMERLFCPSDELMVLCYICHKKEHDK